MKSTFPWHLGEDLNERCVCTACLLYREGALSSLPVDAKRLGDSLENALTKRTHDRLIRTSLVFLATRIGHESPMISAATPATPNPGFLRCYYCGSVGQSAVETLHATSCAFRYARTVMGALIENADRWGKS